ncbi:MAG: hypothetical protein U0744_22090 [Gemmataceae bacterium]
MFRVLILSAAFSLVSSAGAQEEAKGDNAPPAGVQRPPAPPAEQIARIVKAGAGNVPFGGNLLVQYPGAQMGTPRDLVVHAEMGFKVYFFKPFKQAKADDLKIGSRIWFPLGPIAKSRPEQTSTSVIYIMSPPEKEDRK